MTEDNRVFYARTLLSREPVENTRQSVVALLADRMERETASFARSIDTHMEELRLWAAACDAEGYYWDNCLLATENEDYFDYHDQAYVFDAQEWAEGQDGE